MRVAVVVLGDLGRSPRMQYHALALAESGARVDVVAYAGSEPLRTLREHPRVCLHLMAAPAPATSSRLGFIARSLIRVVAQTFRLSWLLCVDIDRPDVFLVQNPPSVPALPLALLASRLRSARLIIDWHNFGYTMIALRLGSSHPVTRMMRWCERVFGRRADANLCVSQAMAATLADDFGVRDAAVLYDRPAEVFRPVPRDERRALLDRLDLGFPTDNGRRPAVIVSPSSWTADEEIAMLLDAAVECDRMTGHGADQSFPDLLILLTGRGPLRAEFERRIERLSLRRIRFRTMWLSAEDYSLMLGAADVGVCCHRSSSGLDLPMKIADMFGAALPVCAYDYGACLREMVREGENGLLFSDSAELARHLHALLRGFPDNTPLLDKLRNNLAAARPISWSAGWKMEAEPVFTRQRPAV